MRRILFIAARLPYPLNDGWKIRTYHLLKGWKDAGASVDLISFSSDPESEDKINCLKELCADIQFVHREKAYSRKDLVKGLLFRIPFSVYNYQVTEMQRLVSEKISNTRYDIIQIEDVVMAQYLPVQQKTLYLLDMHNVESHLLKRYSKWEHNLAKKTYANLTAKKLKHYEKKACPMFDKVLVCSNEDKAILRSYGILSDIEVLPNGVDCDYFKPIGKSETNDLVFVGSMDYHANVSGVIHFIQNILPLIWRKYPEVRLYIVGKNPPESVRGLENERIIVTGMVKDVRTYLQKAKVAVVPLLVGGGTRLKILEAMASGIPVVSTTVGAEGISGRNDEHFFLADDANQFAETVLTLLADQKKCNAVGTAARNLVESLYAWSSLTDKFNRSIFVKK